MRYFFFFVFCLSFSFSAFAQVKPWGLGIILANPTGFSVKHRMSRDNSIDAALGYSFGRSDNLSLHATYLWEFNEAIKIKNSGIGYFFGIGGAFYSRDKHKDPPRWAEDDPDEETALAFRGSGGLNYYFKEPSIEVFLQASFDFFFIPSTDVDLGLAIGGRYFF